jgi:dienelactone hydrolase
MHAFTNPQASAPEHGLQYNPVADRRSWQAMRNFFEELFPGG